MSYLTIILIPHPGSGPYSGTGRATLGRRAGNEEADCILKISTDILWILLRSKTNWNEIWLLEGINRIQRRPRQH